jgi:hypothetical protein
MGKDQNLVMLKEVMNIETIFLFEVLIPRQIYCIKYRFYLLFLWVLK